MLPAATDFAVSGHPLEVVRVKAHISASFAKKSGQDMATRPTGFNSNANCGHFDEDSKATPEFS